MSNNDNPREEGGRVAIAAAFEAAAPRMHARLSSLRVNRFYDVKPGTELRFDDGINVLLGRNGTGKTTLLELICAVVSGDLRAYQKEPFDLEFETILGNLTFSVHAKNRGPSELATNLSVGEGLVWQYSITVNAGNNSIFHVFVDSKGAQVTPNTPLISATAAKEVSLFRPSFYFLQSQIIIQGNIKDVTAEQDEATLAAVTALLTSFLLSARSLIQSGIMSCLRLDEGLDLFRSLTKGDTLPRINISAAVYISTEDTHMNGAPFSNDMPFHLMDGIERLYVPLELFRKIHEQGSAAHSRTEFSFVAKELEFLTQTTAALGVKEIQCMMKLIRRERVNEKGDIRSAFGNPSFWITTHRDATFTHDQLSYGEKRLLTFMYHASANPEILVADELVNGLHHGWIQACLDAIQGQAFLTSQNPLLLDYLPFSSAEEVQRRFILCDRDEHGAWIWRNMDEDAAGAFFRAYKVGIQHVSEILETKGLW